MDLQQRINAVSRDILGVRRIVFYPPSCSDRYSRMGVVSDQHPETPIEVALSTDDFYSCVDAIREAVKQCPGCTSEKATKVEWRATRWPEGAEV